MNRLYERYQIGLENMAAHKATENGQNRTIGRLMVAGYDGKLYEFLDSSTLTFLLPFSSLLLPVSFGISSACLLNNRKCCDDPA